MKLALKLQFDIQELTLGPYAGQHYVDVSVWSADHSERIYEPSLFGPYESRELAEEAAREIGSQLNDWLRKQHNAIMKPAHEEQR